MANQRKRPSQSLGRLHLSSCYFSQAFKDRHFTKDEMFSANALGAVHNCCATDALLRLRLLVRDRRGGAFSQRFETRIVAQWIEHRIEPE
jgi:hypothetical protein